MITRTLTLVRSGLLFATVKTWFQSKVNGCVASAFAWALSKREVQIVVAASFRGRTEMCHALDDAIASALREIEASDIKGLDREVEGYVSDAMSNIEADDIRGLDRMIERAIEEGIDNVTEEVMKELARRIAG